MNIHVADNAREAARMLLRNMLAVIRQPSGAGGEGDTVNVAFSGGSTPAILFDVWVEEFAELTPWNRFRVYWVDERFLCHPILHPVPAVLRTAHTYVRNHIRNHLQDHPVK